MYLQLLGAVQGADGIEGKHNLYTPYQHQSIANKEEVSNCRAQQQTTHRRGLRDWNNKGVSEQAVMNEGTKKEVRVGLIRQVTWLADWKPRTEEVEADKGDYGVCTWHKAEQQARAQADQGQVKWHDTAGPLGNEGITQKGNTSRIWLRKVNDSKNNLYKLC